MNTVFVTSEGREVQLRPVSDIWIARARLAVEKEFEEREEPIESPTYEIETVTGAIEEWPLTEENLEADTEEETDRRKKLWYDHQAAKTRLETDQMERETAVWLSEGIVGEEPTEDWERRAAWAGIELPEDSLDRRVLFITTEILRSQSDLANMLMRLRMISLGDMVVDEGLIEAAEASFRDSVRQKGREAFAGFRDQIRQMVAQPEVPASEGGDGIQQEPVGVESIEPGRSSADDGDVPGDVEDES